MPRASTVSRPRSCPTSRHLPANSIREWVTISRRGRGYDGQLHPEEALTREQAIRFYTANNAYILKQEKDTGSLEPGKLADFIILDRDILTCPLDDLRETQVLQTFLGGRKVYERA